jgi:hypothetical protein
MPEVVLQSKDKPEIERKGLSDGGHVIIRCSNCKKPLVDIWRTRPNEKDPRTGKPFEWKFIAGCCYCGDKSYIHTILGGFHIGGYGINTNDANEAYEKTSIEPPEPMKGREDVLFIKTSKYKS